MSSTGQNGTVLVDGLNHHIRGDFHDKERTGPWTEVNHDNKERGYQMEQIVNGAFEDDRYQENHMVTILDEATKQAPCLHCPGYCYWQNIINLCGYDVWAIASNLHLNPTDFVSFAVLVRS